MLGEPVNVLSTAARIREVVEGDGMGGVIAGRRVDLKLKVRNDSSGGPKGDTKFTKVKWRYQGNDFGCKGLSGEREIPIGSTIEVPLCYSFLDLTMLDAKSWGLDKIEDLLMITSNQGESTAIQFGHGSHEDGMSVRPVLGKRYRVRKRVSLQRTVYTGSLSVGTDLTTVGMDLLGDASSPDIFECIITLENIAAVESFRFSFFTILGTFGGLYTALLGLCTCCVARFAKVEKDFAATHPGDDTLEKKTSRVAKTLSNIGGMVEKL
eukprot:g321.t1